MKKINLFIIVLSFVSVTNTFAQFAGGTGQLLIHLSSTKALLPVKLN